MMHWLPGTFAAAVAAIGWHYLFFSRAAHRLDRLEHHPTNHLRVRLRRVGGGCMFLLGVCFFALFYTVDLDHPSRAVACILLAVLLLLATIVLLAIADLRLTWKLRRRS
jgi:UDP-N-acetylmuramyl pentapeptide phosphotransferase/UDP-N-acetylglucosamine-1-phosphate transferase